MKKSPTSDCARVGLGGKTIWNRIWEIVKAAVEGVPEGEWHWNKVEGVKWRKIQLFRICDKVDKQTVSGFEKIGKADYNKMNQDRKVIYISGQDRI